MADNIIARLKAVIARHEQATARLIGAVNNLHSTVTQAGGRVGADLSGTTGVAQVRADYATAVKKLEEARSALVHAEDQLRQMNARLTSL
jgi:50S ribosomal subunit-associated GTPase HflX